MEDDEEIREEMSELSLEKRVEACLLGGAIGDSLGAEIEFWSLERIEKAFPGRITDLPRHAGIVGAITDDTQMTLFTMEGLIRAMVRQEIKGICSPSSVVHHALLRWLDTQGRSSDLLASFHGHGHAGTGLITDPRLRHARAPGNTCLSALSTIRFFGEKAENQSKGCGTIMRVAPLAFVEPERIRELAEDCSALTHGHQTGQQAASAWALILRGLLDGMEIEAAAQVQLGRFNDEVDGAIRRALDAPRDGSPATVASLGEGWIAEEALSIALYACLCAEDFESGLQIAVRHSGDSDSTGAISGNALGLIYPEDVFAHRWAGVVECRDVIEELSKAFVKASEGQAEGLIERYPGV